MDKENLYFEINNILAKQFEYRVTTVRKATPKCYYINITNEELEINNIFFHATIF